ncbi:hypothetical protein TYRP_020874 [Tyrophagus putrescentiae]|nr:hypothetical protein TYRP_020874 [Tyrophagus putrescentiae]
MYLTFATLQGGGPGRAPWFNRMSECITNISSPNVMTAMTRLRWLMSTNGASHSTIAATRAVAAYRAGALRDTLGSE